LASSEAAFAASDDANAAAWASAFANASASAFAFFANVSSVGFLIGAVISG